MVNDKIKFINNKKENVSLRQKNEPSKSSDVKVSKKKKNKMNNKETEQQQSVIDPAQQFELELCWCIETLENTLANLDLKSKGDSKPSKTVMDLEKTIKTLKSGTQPVIAKRQVMRTVLGDYRTKMTNDKKKWNMNVNNIGFDDKNTNAVVAIEKKGKFIKKVTNRIEINDNDASTNDVNNALNKKDSSENVPDNSFRFNFNVPVDGDSKDLNTKNVI